GPGAAEVRPPRTRRTTMRARSATVLALTLILTVARAARAQTFTKNPDPSSPILADVSTGYSGAAWVDIDNDGNLDLFVANNFLYKGDGAGGFTKISTLIGNAIAPGTGNGTTWADFDNDGDIDCYLASTRSALYRNNGSGVFSVVNVFPMNQLTANRG